MNPAGLPHSEISGSKPVNSSPKLIAACRVLHRLPMPRHPPLALRSLSIKPDQKKSLSYCNPRHKRYVPCGGRQGPPVHHIPCDKGFCTALLFNYQRSTTTLQALRPKICLSLHETQIAIRKMVEVNGIEPMTSCVQGRRSPS